MKDWKSFTFKLKKGKITLEIHTIPLHLHQLECLKIKLSIASKIFFPHMHQAMIWGT